MVIILLSLLSNLSYRMHSLYPLFQINKNETEFFLNKIKKVEAEQSLGGGGGGGGGCGGENGH